MNASRQTAYWWAVSLIAVCGASVVLFFFSPEEYPFYPRCLFHALTGFQCPGCGGLRASHRLLHGEWRTAFQLNPLLVSLIPVLLLVAAAPLVHRLTGYDLSKRLRQPLVLWLSLTVVLLFGVLRNCW